MIQRGRIEQIALLTLARWVANHTRCAANEQVGLVAAALQMAQHHDTAEMTDVQ